MTAHNRLIDRATHVLNRSSLSRGVKLSDGSIFLPAAQLKIWAAKWMWSRLNSYTKSTRSPIASPDFFPTMALQMQWPMSVVPDVSSIFNVHVVLFCTHILGLTKAESPRRKDGNLL